ncbi:hypothetical protein IQ255_26870 [Pleurocapsales cyanobacterium LEGE 10410]|nr:hypothetical protein [Pleurocapsales cyanobacterium LEGE 10410]
MSQLDPSAIKARNNLLGMFVTIVILDSILVAVSRDLWAIGRIVVTIGIMYYVIQGKKWAKWVLIGIFSLVIVLLAALIVALHSKLSGFLIIGSLLLVALYAIARIYLTTSKNLNRYLFNTSKVEI